MSMRRNITAQKDPQLPSPSVACEKDDWVETLKCLKGHEAETLYAAVIALYPHDMLPEKTYRRVVMALDQLATQSPEHAECLRTCVQSLDANFPVPFRDRSESYRTEALLSISATRAFRFLQRNAVRYLYDDLDVWQAFGYEGASLPKGGYLHRGFDDLDWLPPIPTPQHA